MKRGGSIVIAVAAAVGCNQLLGNGNFKTGAPQDAPSPDGPDDQCAAMGLPPTSLSGTVTAPNGTLPIFNAAVYVPSAALAAIPDGVGSATCVSGSPIAITHSDETGHFKLLHVPSGNVDLVVQVGKWRREHVTVPNVMQCTDNAVPADSSRLPKMASEGSMPHIAITTGAADGAECLGRDLGVAPTEIGTGSAFTGHVHLYVQNGITTMMGMAGAQPLDPAANLDTAQALAQYDLVVRGCPGSAIVPAAGAPAILQAWTNAGGWLVVDHYESVWLQMGPAPWPSLATFAATTGGATSATVSIDQSTPIGASFALWAVAVGLSQTAGVFVIPQPRLLCTSIDTAQVTRRLYTDPALNGGSGADVQSFTWDATSSGRVTFNDIHVNGGGGSAVYPAECTAPYPQEKAMLFQLFETPTCN
jgi:hypothetical protein